MGVRKAKEYRSDINRHKRNATIKNARQKYKTGSMSLEKYKKIKKQAKAENKAADKSSFKQIKEQALKNKGTNKKVSSIYEPHRKEAYKTIKNYFIKR